MPSSQVNKTGPYFPSHNNSFIDVSRCPKPVKTDNRIVDFKLHSERQSLLQNWTRGMTCSAVPNGPFICASAFAMSAHSEESSRLPWKSSLTPTYDFGSHNCTYCQGYLAEKSKGYWTEDWKWAPRWAMGLQILYNFETVYAHRSSV